MKTKEDYYTNLAREAHYLKHYCTYKELANLDEEKYSITGFDYWKNGLYGQITGGDRTERAIELIKLCTTVVYWHGSYQQTVKVLVEDKDKSGCGIGIGHFTPLELYLKNHSRKKDVVKNLFAYLRNEDHDFMVYGVYHSFLLDKLVWKK